MTGIEGERGSIKKIEIHLHFTLVREGSDSNWFDSARGKPMDKIVVKGARTHNLKNIDLTIPRDKLVVITGLSGS